MDLKQAAVNGFDRVEDALRGISRWLYENPEIANEEHRSSERLASFLDGEGFAVQRPAHGMETAFRADAGSEGPRVIICAEYDALPEVGHACGHNIIAAAAAGAGVAMASVAGDLGFRVTVLGTPAEEAYGGKVDLIAAGAFEDAAAAMMVHPSTRDEVDPRFLAVSHITVEFFGKESHAAFAPEDGVNALDAAIQAYNNVSMLRQALLPTDKVHGVIAHGGGAPNVIPPYTRMEWYVRARSLDRLTRLRPKVEACFTAAAQATGCRMEITPRGHTYTEMRTDALMVELFAENASRLGRQMGRSSGQDASRAGSTDMANVSQIVPSIHPMLDIDALPAVNHQRAFAAATVEPAGEKAIRDGAVAMAWTVIDIATTGRWDELGR